MYSGDDPLAEELRKMAREQDDREHFASQLEVKSTEADNSGEPEDDAVST